MHFAVWPCHASPDLGTAWLSSRGGRASLSGDPWSAKGSSQLGVVCGPTYRWKHRDTLGSLLPYTSTTAYEKYRFSIS